MTDPLTPRRFADLADAYGGDIARWPEGVRDQARAMARRDDMSALLTQAKQLDERLDTWPALQPSGAHRRRALASRPVTISRRLRLWISGLGVATALAGALAGSAGATMLAPIADHSLSDDATAFGDLA
jgi:hypothetical protein